MPATVYSDGDAIDATIWNDLIYEQVIMTVPTSSLYPVSPTEGQHIYDAETRSIMQYDGSAWRVMFRDWTPFLPDWYSGVDLSADVQTARYCILGGTVRVQGSITFSDSTPISGTPTLTLPVTCSSSYGMDTSEGRQPLGQVLMIDEVGTARYLGFVGLTTTTTVSLYRYAPSAGYTASGTINATAPHTWLSADSIHYDFQYPAA